MSVRATIVAAIAYVLVLAIVVLEVPLVINLSRRVDAEIRAEAAQQAQLISTSVEDRITEPPDRLQPVVEQAGRALGGRVIVVDAGGRVVVDSAGIGLRNATYADRPEIVNALGGETTQGERRSDSLDQDLLFTSVPVIDRGVPVGAVRVTQSVDAVNDEVRTDAIGLIGVGAAALLLGIGVAWVLAGSLAKPPRLLAIAARRVAAGDLEARAPERGPREHREVAHAFNEMTERLASVLSAQRDFVADASHQLRTPLTGLRLRLEAASDATRDPDVADDLGAAEDEVVRLSRLIDNLLTLAREGQEPSAPSTVDLGAAGQAALERWEAEASTHEQRISLVPGPGRAAALASPDDVGIIFDNLLENAIKYGPERSTVTIEWGQANAGAAGEAFLAVSDQGPGLAPGEERSALGRFYRGSAAAGSSGTGLGLAIVDVLAQRWRGSVRLANRREGGLRVEVGFPAASEDLRGVDREFTESLPGPG